MHTTVAVSREAHQMAKRIAFQRKQTVKTVVETALERFDTDRSGVLYQFPGSKALYVEVAQPMIEQAWYPNRVSAPLRLGEDLCGTT